MAKNTDPLFQVILSAVTTYALKALSLGGFWGWLASQAMKYGGQAVYDLAVDAIAKFKRMVVQKKEEKIDLPIINDPTKTVDDKGAAYENLINSGR